MKVSAEQLKKDANQRLEGVDALPPSEAIRVDAERLMAKLTSNARLTTHWPAKNEMTLPVNGEM